MKRSKLDALLREKVRLKISNRRRGMFSLGLCVNGVVIQSQGCVSKRHALNALLIRLRCMPKITIEVRSVKGGGV